MSKDLETGNGKTFVNSSVTNESKSIEQSIKTQAKHSINATSRKRGKYYIAGNVGDTKLTAFVDTAADLSLISPEWLEHGRVVKLKKPIVIKSFDNVSVQNLKEVLYLEVDFGEAQKILKFYVCETNAPIIGIDILRDENQKVSINTKTEMLTIDGKPIKTSASAEKAEAALTVRMGEMANSEATENRGQNWVKVKRKMTIEPRQIASVEVECERPVDGTSEYVFLSFHDETEEEKKFYIPSIAVNTSKEVLKVWVENTSKERRVLKEGTPLGSMKRCDDSLSDDTVVKLGAEDASANSEEDAAQIHATDITTNQEEESGVDAMPGSSETSDAQTAEQCESRAPTRPSAAKEESEAASRPGPVPFTALVGVNKTPAEVLQKCLEDGIEMDLSMNIPEPKMEPNTVEIDIDAERRKSGKCPYWPSKGEFLKNFDLSSTDGESARMAEELLWSFRHIFFNEEYPKQFQQGIQTKPIKMTLKQEGPPLKSEKMRRMNEKKVVHLKKHLQQLQEQGVIEELKDSTGCHLSPVHVVIEQRYVASQRKNVEKSRFVLDQRILNSKLEDAAYPIPFCDEFRRDIASEGYTVFSNCDCSSFYYQFKVEKVTARKLFGFAALGRVYYLKRLPQGCKLSPCYAQAFMDKVFRCHPNCRAFMDDLTIKSKSVEDHLKIDLPKTFAICSKYNILLKPSKCDLIRPDVRILGYQISRSAESLTSEKIDKIRAMSFPTTKKEAVSRAAFFSYFLPVAPRLSELMAPLRQLAHPKKRFKPTESDKESFVKLKEYLLEPTVGAIRVPSSKQEDLIIVWTDASAYSIAGVVTQLLPPLPGTQLDPTKKYLSIVACWSRTIDEAWSSHPIWVLELAALEETTRKFRWLLAGRVFYTLTDSTTVKSWSSIDIVPKDIARRIIRLQKFNYRILFIESKLNISDFATRLPTDDQVTCKFPRFVQGRIFNARGEPMEWTTLFSQEKCDEAAEFFTRHRRQALSYATAPPEVEEEPVDDSVDRKAALEAILRPQKRPGKREEKDNEVFNGKVKYDAVRGCDKATIAAFGLTDEEVESGIDEVLEEVPPDEDIFADTELQEFENERLREVLNLQRSDETIDAIKKYLKEEIPWPEKTEAFILSIPLQQFLRHRSFYRLTKQGVLLRLWPMENGKIDQLVVVGERQYKGLVEETHKKESSSHQHAGQRRTFTALSKRYFAFGGRKHVNKIVAMCATCKLNSNRRTNPEKSGNQIEVEPNAAGAVDLVGPLRGFALTASGNARYIFVYVDLHTRYIVAKVLQSTNDSNICDGFVTLRDTLCGFPKKLYMDNAIATEHSNSLKFLKERGVEVIHGMAGISRCQASVERAIGSLTRQICRMRTDNPPIPFQRLVAESVYVINSTPSTGLAASLAPKDVHFARAPTDFLRHAATNEDGGNAAIQAARAASRQTLIEDVKRHLKRQKIVSPTDYTSTIRVGTLCLRKRTIFPSQAPKKLCYKITMDAYRVTSKVGTNAFRVKSLISGTTAVLPGDHLIKVAGLNEDELITLCREMEAVAAREALETETPGGAVRRSTRRSTTGREARRGTADTDARSAEISTVNKNPRLIRRRATTNFETSIRGLFER